MALFVLAVLVWALFLDGSGSAGSGGGEGGGDGIGIGAGVGSGLADAGTGPGAGDAGAGRGAVNEGGNDVPQGSPDGEQVAAATTPPRAVAPPDPITGRTAPRIGHTVPQAPTAPAQTQPAQPAARGNPAPGHSSAGAAGAGGGGGGTAVEFMGVQTEAKNIVYVLDRSGSMMADDRSYHTYLELRKSVAALSKECTFSIVYFDHEFYPLPERGQMHKAVKKEKDAALDWASTMGPLGATDPSGALRYALEELDCDTIFLMTDGEFDEFSTRNVLSQFNAGARVAIHTIAFHSNAGASILRGIADDYRGQYLFVPPP